MLTIDQIIDEELKGGLRNTVTKSPVGTSETEDIRKMLESSQAVLTRMIGDEIGKHHITESVTVAQDGANESVTLKTAVWVLGRSELHGFARRVLSELSRKP